MEDRSFTLKMRDGEYCRDVTDVLNEIIAEMHLYYCYIHVQQEHTTCALTINEKESGLIDDLLRRLDQLAPRSQAQHTNNWLSYYFHDDMKIRTENIEQETEERRNGHAHVKAIDIDRSPLTLRVRYGKVHLGRWQRVLFFDFDDIGPRRERTISVSIINGTGGRYEL